jgi:hypothetical protein
MDAGDNYSQPDPDEEPDSPPIPADPEPEIDTEPVTFAPELPPEVVALQAQMHTNPEPVESPDFDFAPPSEELQLRIQEALQVLGHYPGKLNGKWGNLSIFGIQTVVAPKADREWNKSRKPGVPDRALCVLIREFAGYSGDNAVLNETAWSDFADALEAGIN